MKLLIVRGFNPLLLLCCVVAVLALLSSCGVNAACNRGYAMRFQGRQPILGTKAQFLDFSDPGMASIDKHMTLSFWARYSGVNPEITKNSFNWVNMNDVNFFQVCLLLPPHHDIGLQYL